MSEAYWILAPVKVCLNNDEPDMVVQEAETMHRALEGHRFETADMAMTWLELIGYPEDDCDAECIEE